MQLKNTPKEFSAYGYHNFVVEFLTMFVSRKRTGRRVLVFFPHNLAKPRSGAHQRAMQIITGLRAIGLDVFLFSSTIFTDCPWDIESVELLNRELGIEVYVHKGTAADSEYLTKNSSEDGWGMFTPPDMVRSFQKIAAKYKPDFLFVNYALWGELAMVVPSIPKKIIEMHDLITLNSAMQQVIKAEIGDCPIDPYLVADRAFKEDYYSNYSFKATEKELKTYDNFDVTIAIAPKEQEMVAIQATRTAVAYIPFVYRPGQGVKNDFSGMPIFVIGANVFNYQGYVFFVRRVLKELRCRHPGFSLAVYGDGCNSLKEVPGIKLNGFVSDLGHIYKHASFAVCPLLIGTGQQLKIIEAMSYGVPVVAMKGVAESSPIKHGINGFIANTAEEFAKYCLQLYADRGLCQFFGGKALESVIEEYSSERMLTSLAEIFNVSRTDDNVEKCGSAAYSHSD